MGGAAAGQWRVGGEVESRRGSCGAAGSDGAVAGQWRVGGEVVGQRAATGQWRAVVESGEEVAGSGG